MSKKINDGLTPKQRYNLKLYENAPMIECACKCGEMIKSKDKHGRNKTYVSGHNNRKYDDPKQYKREWNHRNRESRQIYKYEYIKERRRKLVELAGGECVECGLKHNSKNTVVFDLHHKDPSTKEFNLNANTFNRLAWNKILAEAAKCEILCANCHRLHHWSEEIDN